MCGIAGILRFDGRPVDAAVLQAMTDRLAHRGPDGQGVRVDGPIGLGHRRLAVIDLSEAAAQPMSNEDGAIWISYNGEIYNHAEIRKQLEQLGHRFRSRSDTEVIVHAYEQWGTECLERFNGMFAWGLWDGRKRRLWLVRDRLGIKPLFFTHSPNRLAFASEIKSLLCDAEFSPALDREALAYFLALNWVPAPHTLLADVRQLEPGCQMLVEADGRCTTTRYWQLHFREDVHLSSAQWQEQFTALLEDSVRLRLVSDVPFGAFLSGGLDSSSICYWMKANMTGALNTFSIGFDESSYDETAFARQVAEELGTEHHEQIIRADAARLFDKLIWHSEEPTADASMVSVYYLAQTARRHVTMALSGDGADEILAGYETYPAFFAARKYRRLPQFLRHRLIQPLIEHLPVSHAKISLDQKLRRFIAAAELEGEDAHACWRIIFDAAARRELLAPAWEQPGMSADVVDLYRRHFARTDANLPLNRLLAVDIGLYLPSDMLVKLDRMTMAHGLEARVPFLDYRLVEFCAAVPPALKLRPPRTGKYLLKKAMQSRLPRGIIHRRKQGFNSPIPLWLAGPLKPFVLDTLNPRTLGDTGFIDAAAAARLLDDHFSRRADNSYRIWGLLTLICWWNRFMKADVNSQLSLRAAAVTA
jgi:asparagine synthase (glutamine-hydrolysing)